MNRSDILRTYLVYISYLQNVIGFVIYEDGESALRSAGYQMQLALRVSVRLVMQICFIVGLLLNVDLNYLLKEKQVRLLAERTFVQHSVIYHEGLSCYCFYYVLSSYHCLSIQKIKKLKMEVWTFSAHYISSTTCK